ncbi:uncharacterized protein AKAME5_000874300 [Lates japonicus]|uniref:Uncharacterized protein n=1 Tax=Lates japonicus TaxID=270547 RepID=A0AAD3MLS7_LATJO|nr:uncharacterized protein AKAME5_000874300 [Lates japonicus]
MTLTHLRPPEGPTFMGNQVFLSLHFDRLAVQIQIAFQLLCLGRDGVLPADGDQPEDRPLTSTNIDSMKQSILSLYHSLITGSRTFLSFHSSSLRLFSPPSLLFPVHPEPDGAGALPVDHRSRIQRLEVVTGPVTKSHLTRVRLWRGRKMNVSDYGANGHIIMSVLLSLSKIERCLVTQGKRKGRPCERQATAAASLCLHRTNASRL